MKDASVSISLCMIVRNEEDILQKSLNAIKDFVDEIIIVDTGSTDSTIEIAEDFGAKIFHFVWDDDFAAARNFALKQATCDWVLNLDADHIFICDKQYSLKNPLKNIDMLGLMINERTYDPDQKFQESDRLLLFKNHCGFKYSGMIFEHPLKSIKDYSQKNKIAQPFGCIENCRLDHWHKSETGTFASKHKSVLEKAVKSEPDNYNYHFNLLKALKDINDNERYENALLKTVYRIEQKNPLLNESIVAIWGLFGDWVIEDNNSDSVDKFYKNAGLLNEKTKWNDIRLVWPYVKVSIMQGEFDKAISDLKKCILNGIAPENVYLKEEEYIAPIYQLIKLINTKKPVEDFIRCINKISELTEKTNTESLQVFRFIKKYDTKLFEEISNVLNEEQNNLIISPNENDENYKTRPKNSEQLSISLCMIVKNEQNNLERCLKSVKNIVDEIIIVDTGSTDKSVEIAKKHGSKIIFTAWHNDFSEARNLALEQASGKWILHLDADEELHKESRQVLKGKLQNSHADAINVIVRNHQPAEDMVSFLDETQVRLFQNKKYHRYSNKVHEQIIPSIAENKGKFEESEIIINHFGYQANNEQRAQRNLSLLENELNESPKDAYLLFKIGETYKALKQWDKAAEYLTKAISNPSGNITTEIKEIIYLRLGQIALAKDDHKSAQEYASACLRFNAQNAMAKYILAVSMMYSGKMERGLKLFMELKATQNIHGLDLSEIDRLLEILENVNMPEKVFN